MENQYDVTLDWPRHLAFQDDARKSGGNLTEDILLILGSNDNRGRSPRVHGFPDDGNAIFDVSLEDVDIRHA